jgi:hypothetical protein
MYGRLPPKPLETSARLLYENRRAFRGRGAIREYELRIAPAPARPVYLLLATPSATNPAPCFVGLNFEGNHALLDDLAIRLPTGWMYPNRKGVRGNAATDAGRGAAKNVWNLDLAVERGYAVATVYNGDIDPDRPDVRGGVRLGLPRSEDAADTATVMAWAWGVHRMIDFLETLPEIDKSKIACVGHSRLGKTALVAAAYDDRVALAIPHQSGCGGSAPSRSTVGESVERINTSFPHWFDGNFKKFNREPAKLPFDQHCLIALCAPRPVLLTNAVEDTWANPDGQYRMLQGAEPVYKLLGVKSALAAKPPAIGDLVDGKLGYYIRDGKHSMTRDDWQIFLKYADVHLKPKAAAK